MSFLERADGRERVWNRNKEACGGGSFEQMKENVSYDAGHKHHLYFFFFFFSISSSTSSSTSSSPFLVPYLLFHFLLLSIHISPIFTYILTSIRVAPHNCARLSEFFSFLISLSAIRCCSSSFFVRFISSSLLFLLFVSFSSSFDPFSSAFRFTSSPTTKHVVNLLRFALLLGFSLLLTLVYVSRLLNLDARSRCLHNNFPNKAEIVFGIWNGFMVRSWLED